MTFIGLWDTHVCPSPVPLRDISEIDNDNMRLHKISDDQLLKLYADKLTNHSQASEIKNNNYHFRCASFNCRRTLQSKFSLHLTPSRFS